MKMLLLNAGSSSLKVNVDDGDTPIYGRTIEKPPKTITEAEWNEILADVADKAGEVEGVAHRVLHGGELFKGARLVTPEVLDGIRSLIDLGPLHQAQQVAVLEWALKLWPDAPQVACFDTSFHSHMPAESYTYALPKEWSNDLGVRRYGFHGLAHDYNLQKAAELLGGTPANDLKLVSAHLGSGASLAAIADGHTIDTTMGFTPLEGLVMGTRCGNIDPAIVRWVVDHSDLTLEQVDDALVHNSGFRGMTGDDDMRNIESRAADGDADAQLALVVWAHRAAAQIASMFAAIGGADALAFSGGIGEHSASGRKAIIDRLAFLGVKLDEEANAANKTDTVISAADSTVKVVVVASREDLTMVHQSADLIAAK